MFRSSRQSSAKHDNPIAGQTIPSSSETDKQKQKKRLSFKDPEVEQASRTRGSAVLAEATAEDELSYSRRSLEDLTLEDRGLQSSRYTPDVYTNPVSTLPKSFDHQKSKPKRNLIISELKHKELLDDTRLKQKARMKYNLEEQTNFIEALEPPLPDTSATRCPIIEFSSEEAPAAANKGTGAAVSLMSCDGRIPTIAHHQIQMLNYQLEQQRQQTQTALHQMQLLKDHLAAESAARYKAQMQNHQLMVQNRELVDHIQHLFQQIEDLEIYIESSREQRSRSPSIQDPKQIASLAALNQAGYRRNSASSQSLWSSPNLLSPSYSLGTKSSSSTALTSQPVDAFDCGASSQESGRRQSIKDQPIRVTSPYDTDWRMRRRGSSTYYTPIEVPRPKNGSRPNTNGEANKKTSAGEPITSGRTAEVEKMSKQVDVLAIEDSVSHEYSGSTSTGGQGSWSSRYFKPIPDETQNLQAHPRRDNKQSNNSTESSKKLAKSLEGLRLFNS